MESKLPIFVSYCHENIDKVKLVEVEINKSEYFYALIIANNNEPCKALTSKVKEGIRESHAVIPIFTRESIHAQWINQEVAIADTLGMPIFPVVDVAVMGELKGLIHSELDLPYNFNETIDNSEFLVAITKMMNDLEAKIETVEVNPGPVKNGLFESVKQRLKQHKADAERKQFLQSDNGQRVGIQQATKLFNVFSAKAKELHEETGFAFKVDRPAGEVSVRCENFRIFAWMHFVNNLTQISVVYQTETDKKEPTEASLNPYKKVYYIDQEKDMYGWRQENEPSNLFSADELADYAFTWLVNELTAIKTA
jgi:hypothetical protein